MSDADAIDSVYYGDGRFDKEGGEVKHTYTWDEFHDINEKLAAAEARAEGEREQVRQWVDRCEAAEARAEKAEADFASEREACEAAVRQWNKSEAREAALVAERDSWKAAVERATRESREWFVENERLRDREEALVVALGNILDDWQEGYNYAVCSSYIDGRSALAKEEK